MQGPGRAAVARIAPTSTAVTNKGCRASVHRTISGTSSHQRPSDRWSNMGVLHSQQPLQLRQDQGSGPGQVVDRDSRFEGPAVWLQ